MPRCLLSSLLFVEHDMEEVKQVYYEVIENFTTKTIDIPRISLLLEVKSYGFSDFDLDVSGFNHQPVSEDILIQSLTTNRQEIVKAEKILKNEKPENIIVNELINYSEIDYDKEADLLYKLAFKLINHYKMYLDNSGVNNVINYYKNQIGKAIYAQMMEHFNLVQSEYETPQVTALRDVKPHNYTKLKSDRIYLYTETIEPARDIPSKIFTGFKKACHSAYKFDSKTEKDFAAVLENDKSVLK